MTREDMLNSILTNTAHKRAQIERTQRYSVVSEETSVLYHEESEEQRDARRRERQAKSALCYSVTQFSFLSRTRIQNEIRVAMRSHSSDRFE